jgi:hypothetical protein
MAGPLKRLAARLGLASRRRARETTTPPRGRYLDYRPEPDGRADPGEIVWTWVAYEDDPAKGKDRPVLVVGRDGRTLLGLMLSSQHERGGQRHWLELGAGAWRGWATHCAAATAGTERVQKPDCPPDSVGRDKRDCPGNGLETGHRMRLKPRQLCCHPDYGWN